jgi:hypothetical protein
MEKHQTRQWPPLTREETEFITSWEQVRERQRKWSYGLTHNLTGGIFFGVPIALFFFIEAPRHRGIITHGDLILIMIGICLIILFYSVLRGYVKYDQNESHYQILKMRQDNPASEQHLQQGKE